MIEFRNVSKTFSRKGRDIVALDGINLRVDKGDIFGIIGYSGAGKSTLLRLINRLESPSQGEVVINGESLQNVSGKRLNAVKKDIGMIFQNFNLLNSKTVFHNIAIPLILQGRDKAFIQARVTELLEFVSLSDKVHSYPNELSGGQKQRVGIARALATNPSILLCDEATSALDPHTTVQILLLLAEINRRYGITIVLITHEMSVIQKICNKVAVMEHGKVVEQGDILSLFGAPKHQVTANFVQSVIHDSLPERVSELLQRDARAQALRLEFVGITAQQPIINRVIKDYDIEVNILFASMSEVQNTILGFMIVQILGETAQTEAAVGVLRDAGVKITHV
ncbi:MAG TPA: ATP-binding cassette domain-containing protein [Buttiauxella sp.]|uniref:methionine ABC transporter ATP-binding protein n=1 Tax=Buttiauxella sp. TaxID=1972222 RepID=UPI002B467FDD|nr:ATP-binding cassette domain-containing protein [Buttiauxella sp.]HKM96349.1 ATP-binding cassette domain-containing protein [Buttiauxella sp.]